MTETEHKAAIRAAVEERIEGLLELKKDALTTLHADFIYQDLEVHWLARSWAVDVLWEIVDGLVDEIHTPEREKELTPAQEAALKAAALIAAGKWNGHYKEDFTGEKLVCLCGSCVKLAALLLGWRKKEDSIHASSL